MDYYKESLIEFKNWVEHGYAHNTYMPSSFAINTAINALERQTPKRTCKDELRRIQCSNGHNLPVMCRDSRMPYCPFCGQRIDWEVE